MLPSFCSRIQDCILFLNEVDPCVAFIALFCMWCKTMFSNRQCIGLLVHLIEVKTWRTKNGREKIWEILGEKSAWSEWYGGREKMVGLDYFLPPPPPPPKKKKKRENEGRKCWSTNFFFFFFFFSFFLSFYGLFAKCLACLFYSNFFFHL